MNFRKYAATALLLLTSCGGGESSSLLGSNSTGNGGGAWVCWESEDEVQLRWAVLVDLYEGEKDLEVTLQNFGNKDHKEVLSSIENRLFEASPVFYNSVSTYIEQVEKKMDFKDADLGYVDDAHYLVIPPKRECAGGHLSHQPKQLANYTNDDRLLVQNFIWNSANFSAASRAALIVHEAIYAYLREKFDHQTSDVTRKLVGYTFSTISAPQLGDKLAGVDPDSVRALWHTSAYCAKDPADRSFWWNSFSIERIPDGWAYVHFGNSEVYEPARLHLAGPNVTTSSAEITFWFRPTVDDRYKRVYLSLPKNPRGSRETTDGDYIGVFYAKLYPILEADEVEQPVDFTDPGRRGRWSWQVECYNLEN